MNITFSFYRKGLFSFLGWVWLWILSPHYCSCWARNTRFLWLGYADSSVPKDKSNISVITGIIMCKRNKEIVSQTSCSSFLLPAKFHVQQENTYMSIWPNYAVGNLGQQCLRFVLCKLNWSLWQSQSRGADYVRLLRRMKEKEQSNSLFE